MTGWRTGAWLVYRTLDADKIVETLTRLAQRVAERFPGAGLQAVCEELTIIARETHERSIEIARPDWRLRAAVMAVMALGTVILGVLGWHILTTTQTSTDTFGTVQGIDSAFNIIVLMGAAQFFMITLEERLKRRRALHALHELRSIIHVIDMHQLTKDPWTEFSISQPTPSSPTRDLSVVEIIHYLDYCSEMLSLASKVAVLYSQSFPDPIVTETVNDLERTAASLAQKIWQKINILHRATETAMVPVLGPKTPAPKTMVV
jgi:hypothetical protein